MHDGYGSLITPMTHMYHSCAQKLSQGQVEAGREFHFSTLYLVQLLLTKFDSHVGT